MSKPEYDDWLDSLSPEEYEEEIAQAEAAEAERLAWLADEEAQREYVAFQAMVARDLANDPEIPF